MFWNSLVKEKEKHAFVSYDIFNWLCCIDEIRLRVFVRSSRIQLRLIQLQIIDNVFSWILDTDIIWTDCNKLRYNRATVEVGPIVLMLILSFSYFQFKGVHMLVHVPNYMNWGAFSRKNPFINVCYLLPCQCLEECIFYIWIILKWTCLWTTESLLSLVILESSRACTVLN